MWGAGRRFSGVIRVQCLVAVLLKGSWYKIRLIHFHVRITSCPSYEDCVKMDPDETLSARHWQVKVELVPEKCWCRLQVLPHQLAHHGQSTAEEDE